MSLKAAVRVLAAIVVSLVATNRRTTPATDIMVLVAAANTTTFGWPPQPRQQLVSWMPQLLVMDYMNRGLKEDAANLLLGGECDEAEVVSMLPLPRR